MDIFSLLYNIADQMPSVPVPPGDPFPNVSMDMNPLKDNSRFMEEFTRMLYLLGITIGILLTMAFIGKKFLGGRFKLANTLSMVKIDERRALSPKTLLYVISVEGKRILIAESQNGITKLTELKSNELKGNNEITKTEEI